MTTSAFVALLLAHPPALQPPVFQAQVEVVRLDVAVTRGGRPVLGLRAGDFEVFDNGARQKVESILFVEAPLAAALVLDTSQSVAGERLRHLIESAGAFLEGLRPADEAALVTFSDRISLLRHPTRDFASLREALNRVEPGGSTSLNDALYAALRLRTADTRRAAVVVFSDGADNRSWLSDEDVVEAARRTDAVVHGIEIREALGAERERSLLERVADVTGGRVWRADSMVRLREAFVKAVQELRMRYVLSYTPAGGQTTGWHTLEVRLKGQAADVLARPGYLVPAKR